MTSAGGSVPERNSKADAAPGLHATSLAALVSLLHLESNEDLPEPLFLSKFRASLPDGDWLSTAYSLLENPSPADAPLIRLAAALDLSLLEILSVALAAAVEEDPMVGRAVAYLQSPAISRPTLGLCAHAFASAVPPGQSPLHALATGPALASGLLARANTEAPLPDQTLALPLPILLALRGHDAPWPGTTLGLGPIPAIPLPPSILTQAERHAATLASQSHGALLIRHGSAAEARSVAAVIAHAMGKRPLFVEDDRQALPVPLLLLRTLLPVFCLDLAPGDRKSLPILPFYEGPVLALAGPDGTVERAGAGMLSFHLTVPPQSERQALWERVLEDRPLAARLAETHRQRAGRIAEVGRLARQHAALSGREKPIAEDLLSACRSSEGGGLGALAQSVPHKIDDDALVVSNHLRAELRTLLLRCRARDDLARGLGPSARARYHTGLRALFTGPSGTGKTLAAAWLATQLGLPLYRVDLASVTSKYIGETEKNLAQLFARAEDTEVVLLFDEADSLFGRRTDVRDANDRFANAQTNYLLQRIESFDGIAILTSNEKHRIDPAFSRRLDAIVEFALPAPEERRALWLSHLGDGHAMTPRDINRLAAGVDLAGGFIRNVVLTAAVLARAEGRAILFADVLRGLAGEYKKLGRPVPADLREID